MCVSRSAFVSLSFSLTINMFLFFFVPVCVSPFCFCVCSSLRRQPVNAIKRGKGKGTVRVNSVGGLCHALGGGLGCGQPGRQSHRQGLLRFPQHSSPEGRKTGERRSKSESFSDYARNGENGDFCL
jgi:hypothetical protein